ncbi:hypothetical protein [Hydrogenophaga sp.]|uniref:hypothetical protein n=1 Tax=Hydrogenophaga sp. TaxID=1904254 RepID=UPI002731DF46|nr:hypothetical protein [Hydrogenophaga sp.]MDP2075586.1 hypothetical protein [Hydrogenophaga sp.]MDP3107407.1 hypothetical protein [Hydrogenophaga sp.]
MLAATGTAADGPTPFLTATTSALIESAISAGVQICVHDVLMDGLAARVHRSPSTFRLPFRHFTGMSPLQYRKRLAVQPRPQPPVRRVAAARHHAHAAPIHRERQHSRVLKAALGTAWRTLAESPHISNTLLTDRLLFNKLCGIDPPEKPRDENRNPRS